MNVNGKRILVIGAGMAGLSAARKLAESGRRVMVLEARDRVGGRILTLREHDEVVELGAEFVHGRPRELWHLIEEAGLHVYEIDGENACHADGKLKKCDETGDTFKFLGELEKWKGPDLAFADYPALKELSPRRREEVIQYVQGFNAADYREISIHALAVQQRAEEEIDSDTIYRIREGYDRLPEFLARKTREAGGRIELSTAVEKITWGRGAVHVLLRAGGAAAEYTAEQAVIALPLGVLQQRDGIIEPTPMTIRAASLLRMGPARRFTLIFRERFWARPDSVNLPQLSFLFAHEAIPTVWWTAYPAESNTLTGWVGGPRSAVFNQFTREQIGDAACRELAIIFSVPLDYLRMQLICCATHDWQTDPYTFGAYSYVAAGGLESVLKIAAPVDDTLFFAGEHTDTTGHWGTVHAAVRSGLRAARQILGAPRE
jgi:monoamine oxidase